MGLQKKYYKYIFLTITITCVLMISIFVIPTYDAQNSNDMDNQIDQELSNEIPIALNDEIQVNQLKLFSKSKITEIENGYSLTGIGIQLIFTEEIVFNIGSENVIMQFDGGNSLIPEYSNKIEGIVIPGDEYIIYRDVYDGIDLVFSVSDRGVKSSYIIHSVESLDKLRISYLGEEKYPLSVTERGLAIDDLWIEENLILKNIDDGTIYSKVAFSVNHNEFSFDTEYSLVPFVIDPDYSFLSFGTYLGGIRDDIGYGIVLDSNDNVYVTGKTISPNFPTLNAYQDTIGGVGNDVFLSSFTSDGSLRWSTFLGGSREDYGYSIAIDSSDNVYVTGTTFSPDFPTLNAHQDYIFDAYDVFVSSFTSDGSIRWSTYLGGSDIDEGWGIEVDSNDNVYVTGRTYSSDFPILNAYQDTLDSCNAFVSSFSSDGALRWSTFLGGSGTDWGYGIAMDNDDNVYVTGYSRSSNFPILNAYQDTHAGMDYDGFVSSFTSDGSLRWSTFLGGSGEEVGYDIVVDLDNNLYVTGYTYSSDFPILNANNDTYGGDGDIFISSFTSDGSLRWSTFLGGSAYEYSKCITVDSNNNIYVTGRTDSLNFPTFKGYQNSNGGSIDVFVSSFTSDGLLLWSTFMGGSGNDAGYGIKLDGNNNIYLTGYTYSSDFPTLNAYKGIFDIGGYQDVFILNILNPLQDFDGDGMSNQYEYVNGLNVKVNDADLDLDGDGLTNLEEHNLGTNPNNVDSDGDGDPDGYEIEWNHNPLDSSSSPSNTIRIILIVSICTAIVFTSFAVRHLRLRKTRRITNLGFPSVDEFKVARKLGFDSTKQKGTAIAVGCLSKHSYEIMIDNNYSSAQEMNEGWIKIIADLTLISEKIIPEEISKDIKKTRSPIEISELFNKYNSTIVETVKPILASAESALKMLTEIGAIKSKKLEQPFEFLTFEQIDYIKQQMEKNSSKLNSILSLSDEFEERIKWVAPSQKILEVIQKTQVGIPVQLTRIAELSGVDLDQTEERLISILQNNPKIGQYLELEQVYIRGEDVGSTIDDLLDDFSRSEQDKIGKIE